MKKKLINKPLLTKFIYTLELEKKIGRVFVFVCINNRQTSQVGGEKQKLASQDRMIALKSLEIELEKPLELTNLEQDEQREEDNEHTAQQLGVYLESE